jgi:hypothetical protein
MDLGVALPERVGSLVQLQHVAVHGGGVALRRLALLPFELFDATLELHRFAALAIAIVADRGAPPQLLAFPLEAVAGCRRRIEGLPRRRVLGRRLGEPRLEHLVHGRDLRGSAPRGRALAAPLLLALQRRLELGGSRPRLGERAVQRLAKARLALQVVP